MLRLYDYAPSGNCYKIRLLLSQLGIAYERVAIDILEGEARSEDFTARNPLQKVPVLEWPDGRRLTESNAILFYLADGTEFLPDDAWQRAQVLQWQSFEQFSLVPYVGAVRFWHLARAVDEHEGELDAVMERGYRALRIMESHLSNNEFFVADRYSIADVTLYAYTHVAPDAGFDLGPYDNLLAWLSRVAGRPRFVAITD